MDDAVTFLTPEEGLAMAASEMEANGADDSWSEVDEAEVDTVATPTGDAVEVHGGPTPAPYYSQALTVAAALDLSEIGDQVNKAFIPRDDWFPSPEEVAQRLNALLQFHDMSPWVGGDIYLAFENKFGGESDPYHMLLQLLPDIGTALTTLQNWIRVSRAFEPSERIYDLSWTHYLRVASLPRAAAHDILARAASQGLSSAETLALAKKSKQESAGLDPLGPEEIKPSVTVYSRGQYLARKMADDLEVVGGEEIWEIIERDEVEAAFAVTIAAELASFGEGF